MILTKLSPGDISRVRSGDANFLKLILKKEEEALLSRLVQVRGDDFLFYQGATLFCQSLLKDLNK